MYRGNVLIHFPLTLFRTPSLFFPRCWTTGYKVGSGKTFYAGAYTFLPEESPLRAYCCQYNNLAFVSNGVRQKPTRPDIEKQASVLRPRMRTHQQIAAGLEFPEDNDDVAIDQMGPVDDAPDMTCDAEDSDSTSGSDICDVNHHHVVDDDEESDDQPQDHENAMRQEEEGHQESEEGGEDEHVLPRPTRTGHGGIINLPGFDCSGMVTYDFMHTACGVAKDLWKCLRSLRNNASVKRWEQVVNGGERYDSGDAPWELNKEDEASMHAAIEGIIAQFPASLGGGERLRSLLRVGKKTKSHTWSLVAGPIGMYLFMTIKATTYELNEAFIEVLRVMHLLGRKTISKDELHDLQEAVVTAVANAEFWVPASELDIKLHNLLHFVDKIRDTGPVGPTSMWVYESMWHNLGQQATKRDTPEVTCLRRIADQEALHLHFSSHPEMYNMKSISEEVNHWDPRSLYRSHIKQELPCCFKLDKSTLVQMTPKQQQGLHSCYLMIIKELAEMWYEYTHSLQQRLRTFSSTEFLHHAEEFSKWSPAEEERLHPSLRANRSRLRAVKLNTWQTCSSATVGGAKFSKKPGECYIVCLKDDTDDLWVGKIKNIYCHMGPLGTKVVFEVHGWHTGANCKTLNDGKPTGFWDEIMKLPVLIGEPLRDYDLGNLVLADQVAPLSQLVVMPHPLEPENLVLFHKHLDFLEAAGFQYDIANPHKVEVAKVMKAEMKCRRERARAYAINQ